MRSFYTWLLTEGIEDKMPHLVKLVDPDIEDKEEYVLLVAQDYDPTPNKEYISWILKMKRQRYSPSPATVRELLEKFTRLKLNKKFPKEYRDINRYKNLSDLSDIISNHRHLLIVRIPRGLMENGIRFIGGTKEGEVEYCLYEITEESAAKKYFADTSWCVREPDMFQIYNPPLQMITKNGKPDLLLSVKKQEFKNSHDLEATIPDGVRNMINLKEVTDYFVNEYVVSDDGAINDIIFMIHFLGGGYNGELTTKGFMAINEYIDREWNQNMVDAKIECSVYNPADSHKTSVEMVLRGVLECDLSPYAEIKDHPKFRKALYSALMSMDIGLDENWGQVEYDDIYGNIFQDDLKGLNITRYKSFSAPLDSYTIKDSIRMLYRQWPKRQRSEFHPEVLNYNLYSYLESMMPKEIHRLKVNVPYVSPFSSKRNRNL
jgi:hypothetical protein